MERLRKIAASIAASKWFGIISGWGAWYSSSVYYDRYVYPSLMLYFGIIWGGIIAASIAMFICTVFLLGYVLTGAKWIDETDEIFARIVKKIAKITRWVEKIEGYSFILRVIFIIPRLLGQLAVWLMELSLSLISKRGVSGFIILSCIVDPFVTVSYFRNGRTDGISAKDWGMFFISGVITNTYWIVWNSVIVVAIKSFWGLIILAI